MFRSTPFFLVLALLPFTVLADPSVTITKGACESKDPLALGLVTVSAGDITLYVDDRDYLFGDGIWVWQESNLDEGLQRGGITYIIPPDEPPVWGWDCDYAYADTMVF
ncbi:MAG: hypothetical protein WDA16_02705 [Candidatus Thermoplasmatota archaeon]